MKFIAHKTEKGEEQLLRSHLLGVAQLTRQFASGFHAGELGYAVGLLHDLGKYKELFQRRIRGQPIAVTHSTAGALEIVKESNWRRLLGSSKIHKDLSRLAAYAIAFHHGGLRDYGTKDEAGSLCYRLNVSSREESEQEKLWSSAWKEIELPEQSISATGPLFHNFSKSCSRTDYAWKLAFLGRMIYSCLVDADTLDTRAFCEPNQKITSSTSLHTIPQLKDKLDRYLANRFKFAEDTVVNRYRKAILETCRRQAELTPRLFSLTVPTGGGKTFSSLSFALGHATSHEMLRVIYVIPFTSIVDQNAAQFREALGREVVLEHHSNFNIRELEEQLGEAESLRYKLSTENWDSPVVVTTSVQFFESLFANKRSKCRKLHNIANSVIILDEAQSLPRGYLEPCLRALEELVEGYGCSVVLCTATQPSWSKLGRKVTEIMNEPSPEELFQAFQRVSVELERNEISPDEQIADRIIQEPQVLCIVNTRKHAQMLLDRIDTNTEGIYHLSGRMIPKHRMMVLRQIRDRLRLQLPCRVISTQLIEAGVDVDFPVVLRAYAGLDSIAQAAGRCNREGKIKSGKLIIFHPEPHGMPSRGWLKETAVEAQNCMDSFGTSRALSLGCVTDYFERIHGIRDEEAGRLLRDEEDIVKLSVRTPAEIPYEEIADKFQFIDSIMEAVVVPWCAPEERDNKEDPYDPVVRRMLERLEAVPYPAAILRELQPYTVQIYRHELKSYERQGILTLIQGVYVMHDLSFYDSLAGLRSPSDLTESAVYIF